MCKMRFLLALANNCPKLRKVDINVIFSSLDAKSGLIELIEKSPLTSFKLTEIYLRESVMDALLASQLQLQEVSFEIVYVSSLQLSRFFKKFPTLQSFDGGRRGSNDHYDTLLQFVTDNKFLRFFKVAFDSGNGSQITLHQLNNFITKCGHIDTVIIDLTYFAGLKKRFLEACS